LLDGEVIKEVGARGKFVSLKDAQVFDATGLIVAPGFIDMHVHLREPGQEVFRNDRTGTKSAARGGFTAVCCMPNTKPVHDNSSITRFIVDKARSVGSTRVWPIGAASVESKGEAIAEIAAMKEAGIVAVSDDGNPSQPQAHASSHGLLQLSRFAGDRTLGRRFARRRAVMREASRPLGSACAECPPPRSPFASRATYNLPNLPAAGFTSPIFLREGRSTRCVGPNRAACALRAKLLPTTSL